MKYLLYFLILFLGFGPVFAQTESGEGLATADLAEIDRRLNNPLTSLWSLTFQNNTFDLFPVGQGWDMEVNEFDFADDGGVVYEKDGVKIIHWRQSHTEDGASAYRLDWNGMCVAFTGDDDPHVIRLIFEPGTVGTD